MQPSRSFTDDQVVEARHDDAEAQIGAHPSSSPRSSSRPPRRARRGRRDRRRRRRTCHAGERAAPATATPAPSGPSAALPSPPSSRGDTNQCSSSTRPSRSSAAASPPPPSTSSSVTPAFASSRRPRRRSRWRPPARHLDQTRAHRLERAAPRAPRRRPRRVPRFRRSAPVQTRAGRDAQPRNRPGRAAGRRTTRSPRRAVSSGSSASAVPEPTMTASVRARRRCTSARAAGPVIQRDSPLAVAMRPSSVLASLSAHEGAAARAHRQEAAVLLAAFRARARRASPRARRGAAGARPRPETVGWGSTCPTQHPRAGPPRSARRCTAPCGPW